MKRSISLGEAIMATITLLGVIIGGWTQVQVSLHDLSYRMTESEKREIKSDTRAEKLENKLDKGFQELNNKLDTKLDALNETLHYPRKR